MLFSPSMGLLHRYLRPQGRRVMALGSLLLSTIGLQLFAPQLIRYFIDQAQAHAAMAQLLAAAGLFLLAGLAQQGLTVLFIRLGSDIAWTATNHLRTDLLRHLLHLDLAFHHRHTPGELLERIDGDVDLLATFFSETLLQILSGLLLAAGVLVLLFWTEWRVGLLFACFALAYLYVHTRGQRLALPHWRLARQAAAEFSGFVGEQLDGRRDLQGCGAVPYALQGFLQRLRELLGRTLRAEVITDAGWSASKIFYDLGTVVVMGVGAYLYHRDTLTIGTVYLLLHYLSMLNQPLNRIAQQMEEIQRARVGAERIQALLAIPPADTDEGTASLPAGQALAVTWERVTFDYRAHPSPGALLTDGLPADESASHGDSPALHDISFALEAGQVLGLLGRTGSGKSTLARLLLRLYDPTHGRITLDGVDLRQVPRAEVRRRVGFVTQDVQIFHATVRENLTLFDETIQDRQILESLERLGLTPWLDGLPAGLDTLLGGEGGGLSAGQAQLLALARVFLRNPGLVILDEPSSRLDPATERLLDVALDHLLQGRTGIIIAHRLETIRRAHQILILEQGRVLEQGTYAALAEAPDSVFAGLLRQGLEEVLV
ncbi:MAG: helicase [Litorilinea sp.]|nr:MAG: helicase [Litorilinea sp.]